MIRLSTAFLFAAVALAGVAPALAQSTAPAGIERGADWTFDTSGVSAAHKGKKAPATRAAPSPEDATRAARLAEGRRKFFEGPSDDTKKGEPPQFGGYKAATDSGTFRPGAQFRF